MLGYIFKIENLCQFFSLEKVYQVEIMCFVPGNFTLHYFNSTVFFPHNDYLTYIQHCSVVVNEIREK